MDPRHSHLLSAGLLPHRFPSFLHHACSGEARLAKSWRQPDRLVSLFWGENQW